MQWKELNKESLETLKKDKLTFWCYVKDVAPIVSNVYKICLISRIQSHPISEPKWFVLSVRYTSEQIRDLISDEDMFDFFSHYCIMEEPTKELDNE